MSNQLEGKTNTRVWVLDLRASEYITRRRDYLSNRKKIYGPCPITTPGGMITHATEIECIILGENTILTNVLNVPNLHAILFRLRG